MRYGMLKLSETLGKPLGALLGNYILNEGTYLWNYLSLMLLFVDRGWFSKFATHKWLF